jgi:hypothetical protein
MRKIELVAVLASLAIATPAMAQGRGRGNGGVPPGQRPAAGMCRIWIDGVPPGQQPAPTDCATAAARVPVNGRIIYGDRSDRSSRQVYDQNGRIYDPNRRVYDQNGQVIGRTGQTCVQQLDPSGRVRTVCPDDDDRDDGYDRVRSQNNRADEDRQFDRGKSKAKKHKGHGKPNGDEDSDRN